MFRAWGLLLQAGPAARKSSAYQRDLVDTTRQALGNLGFAWRDQMTAAYERKDPVAFQRAAGQFMALGRDLDKFLGTRTEFMLGKWIGDAKSWAANKEEQAYYEKDARSIITIWGGGLTDYAGRQWNGLMSDYYLPRWQMFIDATLAELKGGMPVDRPALEKQWREHDLKFATTAGGDYATQAARRLFRSEPRALQKIRAAGNQWFVFASPLAPHPNAATNTYDKYPDFSVGQRRQRRREARPPDVARRVARL